MQRESVRGISPPFDGLSPTRGQIPYALLSRLPLSHRPEGQGTVRLACIRRAASVRPEPGSNSLKEPSFHYPVVKVLLPRLLYPLLTGCQSTILDACTGRLGSESTGRVLLDAPWEGHRIASTGPMAGCDTMNILGVDPGLHTTGYGVVRVSGSRVALLEGVPSAAAPRP